MSTLVASGGADATNFFLVISAIPLVVCWLSGRLRKSGHYLISLLTAAIGLGVAILQIVFWWGKDFWPWNSTHDVMGPFYPWVMRGLLVLGIIGCAISGFSSAAKFFQVSKDINRA